MMHAPHAISWYQERQRMMLRMYMGIDQHSMSM
eukprot:CAMPEP_0169474496 /NCGR_PEP_ID=MMETSP1042-20121227/26290_1 /TAXON_ID=464988 /ORGANISM="Hemiselmis andersenii, Strain CCMP1180" /LENGTH=32 /DNA_ID= /DNA_START= /DNA_END= /DNA_ORIENTATION=